MRPLGPLRGQTSLCSLFACVSISLCTPPFPQPHRLGSSWAWPVVKQGMWEGANLPSLSPVRAPRKSPGRQALGGGGLLAASQEQRKILHPEPSPARVPQPPSSRSSESSPDVRDVRADCPEEGPSPCLPIPRCLPPCLCGPRSGPCLPCLPRASSPALLPRATPLLPSGTREHF